MMLQGQMNHAVAISCLTKTLPIPVSRLHPIPSSKEAFNKLIATWIGILVSDNYTGFTKNGQDFGKGSRFYQTARPQWGTRCLKFDSRAVSIDKCVKNES